MRRVGEIGGLCPRTLAMNCQPAFGIIGQIGNKGFGIFCSELKRL